MNNVISLTDSAAKQVKLLIEKRAKPTFGVRIGVKSGGCAGQIYYVEYADSKNQFDEVVEDKGVRILIDPKALMYILGSEIDYVETKFKSQFTFTNPNEKAGCGCGRSFSV
ncbi:HesB/IscA family protein [Rickettsia australis]|uniref:Iron-sulfur cluster assembly accessory protein n=1 Tax=Rickettsia australis (strain Cutlack) TaxID=1105110 RepID=H8K777_RICAC|nr:iron-sulfur cluster assembly accessory protein [Rickettsia australis]AFC71120.1 iron-sulfur cluster assembly accessory protein [Rickettsia australis str. Cutlack]